MSGCCVSHSVAPTRRSASTPRAKRRCAVHRSDRLFVLGEPAEQESCQLCLIEQPRHIAMAGAVPVRHVRQGRLLSAAIKPLPEKT